MSEPNSSAPQGDEAHPEEDGEALQFDQAEFATPASDGPACTVCHRPIADEYYELNGKVFCARCRHGVEAAFRGGSPFARVIKALILGSVAAAVGASIYYAIIRTTGWNIGLVSVVVGLMVGGAVRRGSGNRGGLGYQFLALFLTYSAIVAMLLPVFLEASVRADKENQAKNQEQAKAFVEKLKARSGQGQSDRSFCGRLGAGQEGRDEAEPGFACLASSPRGG